jgi:hypothetical protein
MQIGLAVLDDWLGVCVVFVSKTQVNPSADLVHPEGQAVTAALILNDTKKSIKKEIKTLIILIIL